jgi:teichuronic acid biosynthesis glycosyltransferase TuaC
MKILIVCSGNIENFNIRKHQAFIYDQVRAIIHQFEDVKFSTFLIHGKGIKGYLSNLAILNHKIKKFNPDLIHAHGGYKGFLCNLQRTVPVVTTFHGSDINDHPFRIIQTLVAILSRRVIYVSKMLKDKMVITGKYSFVIPCGVDFDVFYPVDKESARLTLGLSEVGKYVLFSSYFSNADKLASLARRAMESIPEVRMLEIIDRTREEVNLLINGAELLLLTSKAEGSPQIVKEAMACNIPIVSTDVGDVKDVLNSTDGTYICSFDPDDVAEKIRFALEFGKRTNGREKIGHLGNRVIAEKIYKVYKEAIGEKS